MQYIANILYLVVLKGFEMKEKAYRNLPEALLHWKVTLEVVRVYTYNWFTVVIECYA